MSWRLDPVLLRLTGGRVASTLVFPTAVLETEGARSGARRRNAVITVADGDRTVIVASNAGDPHHPAWFHNLRAHPDVLLGGRPVRATVVDDEAERERLWVLADAVFPAFARYRSDAVGGRAHHPAGHPQREAVTRSVGRRRGVVSAAAGARWDPGGSPKGHTCVGGPPWLVPSVLAGSASALVPVLIVATLLALVPGGAPAGAIPVIAPGSAYVQVNLASDVAGVAEILDPVLINPWGLASGAEQPAVDRQQRHHHRQPLRRRGQRARPPRHAGPRSPSPEGCPPASWPTPPTASTSRPPRRASTFLYASITGNISAWASGATATTAASHPGHVYTGLAQANNGANDFLYAADFANGTIDVFDEAYALQPSASFPFADPTIPTTPGNTFHPYNIQAIGGSLYVTYAKVGTGGLPEDGVGNGFVRRFNANGVRDLTFGINNGAAQQPVGHRRSPRRPSGSSAAPC